MAPVNQSPRQSPTGPLGLDPVVAGTACCVISALGYTGSNICMRNLAQPENVGHAMWAVCNKEVVTVAVMGPWLLWQAFRRKSVVPSYRVLGLLVAVGLAVQLGANTGVQWAFGQVGLAVTVPAIFAVLLTASAVLGLVFLGERVSRRSAAAIGTLLFSLVLLGLAAAAAGKSTAIASSLTAVLGIAAACGAGAIYAVLTITIRHAATGVTPIGTIVFVTTFMGVLTLGPLSARLLGTETLLSTTPQEFAWMYAAGTLNLIAFLAITKGLELTTVVHANVLNASQVTMAAVAGMMLFNEPLTGWLIAGACLTIMGVLMIDRPAERDVDLHA